MDINPLVKATTIYDELDDFSIVDEAKENNKTRFFFENALIGHSARKSYSDALTMLSSEHHCMDIVCDVNSSKETSESDDMEVDEQSETTTDISVEIPSEMECYNKSLSVHCLQTYEDLSNTCKDLGLKFMGCSRSEIMSNLFENGKSPHYLKRCTVKCLQSLKDMENECKKRDLYFKGLPEPKFYEVDLILDDKYEEGGKMYLVKWKKFSLKTNTWEPLYHFADETLSLISYYESIKRPPRVLTNDMLCRFVYDLITRTPSDVLTLRKLYCLIVHGSAESLVDVKLSATQQKAIVKGLLTFPVSMLSKMKGKLLPLMRFSEARKVVLLHLKEWENEINSNNLSSYIKVENNVDLETPPADFEFIHDYVSTAIEVKKDPYVFCSCDNCYDNKNKCCSHDSDGPFPYTKYQRLQLLPGYPIYECNKKCKCGADCINRVVQNGPKIKVAIFKTSNGVGWGLKTLQTIQKDQFVLEYLGEIITSDVAERRGDIYDYVGRSYLFDLDYGEENCQYTVDAGHLGNASHFINHSCNPNLHVFAVWIDQQDPHLPRLAFFAKRKINRGDELTFDYKMIKNRDKFSRQPDDSARFRVPCLCNSKNCRKYLF